MKPTRRSILFTAAAMVAASSAIMVPASPASAASFTMNVVSPVPGGIGIDAIYTGGGGGSYDVFPCSHDPNAPVLNWNSAGNLVGNSHVPSSVPGLGSLSIVRFEMYPGPCGTYDAWTSDVGGVHIQFGPSVSNLGTVVMPVLGQPGVFRMDGDIVSASPIAQNRVEVDTFQLASGYPDPPAPLQTNGRVDYGAFGASKSQGAKWTGGVAWAGKYLLFIRDTATDRHIAAFVEIAAGSIPTIDLDAVCFGFEVCTESAGSPPPVPGTFYPTPPTRILDTRVGIGIANGPIRSGDGRHWSPDPITRRDEAANHELKVTGRFGIPETGVSAVLLTVTAVGAPGPGYLSIVPKPPRATQIFDDQGSFGSFPSTSNLNVEGAEATPNMVLARVGAGGKIRFHNPFGPTHVIADVAGWFGTAGLHDDGFGFEGVVPKRLMDSRNGRGGPARRFDDFETRYLKVAGVAGIPENAKSVVVNLTSVLPDRPGSYVTAFPKGKPLPTASNLNGRTNGVRANLAVVKVGEDGKIGIHSGVSSAHLIVDVLGSFGPSGGPVTTINPVRSIDTRTGAGTSASKLGPGETRALPIRGRAGVPSNATAVVVNITSTNSTAGGYFTAFPSDAERPIVSNVNFNPSQTVPNLALIELGPNGKIKVFNVLGSADLIVDVMGYVT